MDSPLLTAELLLAHVLGTGRAALYTLDILPPGAAARFRAAVRRRASGAPLQYVTGTAAFRGLLLSVRRGVLVPRPETELLVERALAAARAVGRRPVRVLDIGTGSGAIALSIAAEMPDARVAATDRSPAALRIARENARKLGLSRRIRILAADLFPPEGRFDLVCANPPYIPRRLLPRLPAEVRREPRAALDGGPDGLAVIRRILARAAERLAPDGRLVMEIGAGQAALLRRTAAPGLRLLAVDRDLAGIERIAVYARAPAGGKTGD